MKPSQSKSSHSKSGRSEPTAVESLVNALLDSGPEVAEHVVNAARELVLAATTVVDAFERAVQEQQELRRRETATGASDGGDDSHDNADDGAGSGIAFIVRHLDVAE